MGNAVCSSVDSVPLTMVYACSDPVEVQNGSCVAVAGAAARAISIAYVNLNAYVGYDPSSDCSAGVAGYETLAVAVNNGDAVVATDDAYSGQFEINAASVAWGAPAQGTNYLLPALSDQGGLQIGAAVLLVWALAWGFRQIVRVVRSG